MKPGERIRFFRENKGLTQAEFAEELGFSNVYLSEIETGKKDPSEKVLDKLEKVFGIPREYILYSGTHAQWEKIEATLRTQGLDDTVLEKIKPHYLAALVLGGKEEFQRGFQQGMIACDPQVEYKTLSSSTKKSLESVREILETGPDDVVTALEANIRSFLKTTRAAKEKRIYPRVLMTIPVDFQVVNEPETRPGMIVNGSQMGFLVQTSHDMPVGSRIHLNVLLPGWLGDDSFRASAEILWKNKGQPEDGEAYQYGIKFVEVLNEGHAKLDALINGSKREKHE